MVAMLIDRFRADPRTPLLLVSGTAMFALALNLYGLLIGITIVLSHLLYLPIILTSFYYPRRGVWFAMGISAIYFTMIAATRSGYPEDLVSAAARCGMFIVIAFVVSYLSLRLKENEQRVVLAKEEWERTFDAVPDLIALIDLNHKIIRVNRTMAEKLCLRPEQAVGLHCYEVIHCTDAPPDICPHLKLIRDGNEHTSEVHEDRLGGDFLVSVSPLRNADGIMIGSVHVARDITERRVLEQEMASHNRELLSVNEALEQVNKKLNILSSVTRHDILNKITALLVYLELSQELTKDPSLLEYIHKEIDTIRSIERQIDFTRYYQDIGVRSPEWQDVSSIIRSVAAQLPLEAVTLQVHLDGISVFSDPLIEKVFYNLMENSVRHGEHITAISVSIQKSADALTIVYEDNGIGIPPENKEKIFIRGFGKHTGLGLFLIREILSITGITIAETGEYGKGARFEINVPQDRIRQSVPSTDVHEQVR